RRCSRARPGRRSTRGPRALRRYRDGGRHPGSAPVAAGGGLMIPAGVFAATLVGYADDGALDLDRTGAHYARLRERGIDGLFVGGTTGESFLLDRDERAAIIEHADATLGDFPWIAHVGSMDTTATIELTRLADQTGAAAIAVITPVYFALSAREHAEHFRAVGRETSKPLIAYHIPARSGVQLGPDFFADLAAEGVL